MSKNKKLDAAFTQFQNKQYKDAIVSFDEILSDREIDAWIRVRVEQFKTMAEQTQVEPEGISNDLKSFSYLLNICDYERAEDMLSKLEIRESDKAYLKAEIAIEKGDKEAAISLLRGAIGLDEHNLGYALNSPSFSDVLNDEEFAFLRKHEEA